MGFVFRKDGRAEKNGPRPYVSLNLFSFLSFRGAVAGGSARLHAPYSENWYVRASKIVKKSSNELFVFVIIVSGRGGDQGGHAGEGRRRRGQVRHVAKNCSAKPAATLLRR